jgi:plasmid stabilization system protein ParE
VRSYGFAIANREATFDYMEADIRQAAIAVDDRIQSAVDGLCQFPEVGRPGRVEGTRELVIQRTPYIAAYRIADDALQILRGLHGAQRWPDDIPEESKSCRDSVVTCGISSE